MSKLKKAIIVAYFGKFPSYFKLFLDSCSHNEGYDFILITDQVLSDSLPNNITLINMSFDSLRRLTVKKLGEDYNISSPYKLCDYRPAYGVMFEDFLTQYDIWGYCDMDLIFGDIDKFISEDNFTNYDRLLTNGHLGFYKNTNKVNNYYLSDVLGKVNFKQVASIKEPFFFDEIFSSLIFSKLAIPIFKTSKFIDVLPQKLEMKIKEGDNTKNHPGQKFIYNNGKIYHEYRTDERVVLDEYMYIHLQKRKMEISNTFSLDSMVYINPNVFTTNSLEISGINKLRYEFDYLLKQVKKININRIKVKMLIIKYTKKYKGGVG